MRVLHVVENLDTGAVETWLVRMFRFGRLSGADFDWTFFCQLPEEGENDKVIDAMGSRVVHSPVPLSNIFGFMLALRREAREGDYDAFHFHHDIVSAVYLLAVVGLPGKKIVHVHNADEVVPVSGGLKQKLLRPLFRLISNVLSDQVVGISDHTLKKFNRGISGLFSRANRVHYYGLEADSWMQPEDTSGLRESLSIPAESRIILFLARIDRAKQPLFALEVVSRVLAKDENVHAVFAGTGSHSKHLVERIYDLGIKDRVQYLGWRSDAPTLMKMADLFILPHVEDPKEGFGLAVLEAQLAGLPLLISTGVADDPLLPGCRYRQLSLSDAPEKWADAALELLEDGRPDPVITRADFLNSPFEMNRAMDDLLALYR